MSRADNLFIIGCLLILIAACDLFSSIESKPRPLFAVGDCITFTNPLERWERPIVSRIEEVGERNYRRRYYQYDLNDYSDLDWTLSFRFSDMYKKIECPK